MNLQWAVGVEPSEARAKRLIGIESPAYKSASHSDDELSYAPESPTLVPELLHAWKRLLRAGAVSPAQQRRFLAVSIAMPCLCAATAIGLSSGLPLLGIPLTFLCIIALLKRASFKRAERFERDYPSMLIAIASSVRTGSDPLIAMQQARNLFASETEVHRELDQFCLRVERGDSEEKAVLHFASTIDHPDIALFRVAFLLSRREGSSLAKCLHRLARVTRNRQSFRRKVRAAVAMQKLSAFGIAGCALLIVGFQAVASHDALVRALEHPMGSRMLGAALCLVMAGLVGMLRMSRAKI